MYKIGDEVETLYGVCLIENHDTKLKVFHTKHIKTQRLFMFYEDSLDILGLYRTAHEKLIEMGYQRVEDDEDDCFVYKKGLDYVTITKSGEVAVHDKNTYFGASYFDLTLSRILTQYLEELDENTSL